MGKRSNFARRAGDFYATPLNATLPLVPFLRGVRTFAEPCAGEGDLVRHLESFGLRCVYQGDIRTGQDALERDDYGAADCIITNPPFRYPEDPPRTTRLMRDLVRHFLDIGIPFWLLLPHDWSTNKNAAPFLAHCSDIVAVGRVRWIAGSKNDGKDNACWYRFDARHKSGPVFHGRDQGEAIASRRTRICGQCGKRYERWQRSSSRFCSPACKQQAYRKRLIVTPSVTALSVTPTVTAASSELFRYVQHADVQRFREEGWELLPALDGTHHGEYSALMRRRVERD